MELEGCLTRLFFLSTTKMKALILGPNGQGCADGTASAAVRKQRRRAQYRDVVARCEGGAVKREGSKGRCRQARQTPNRSQAKTAPKAPFGFGDAAYAKHSHVPATAIRKLLIDTKLFAISECSLRLCSGILLASICQNKTRSLCCSNTENLVRPIIRARAIRGSPGPSWQARP